MLWIASRSLTQAEADIDVLDTSSITTSDWILAGAVLVATLAIAVVVSRLVRRGITHAVGDGLLAGLVARVAAYITVALGATYALTVLGVRVMPLLGALGLGGLVLALALQKVVENFIGALIIQSRRPFTVGDTVDLEGIIGVVVDVDGRETVLSGLDGTEYRIPNGTVIATEIHNLTRNPARRSELIVGVAYDTDLEAAHAAILAGLSKVRRVLDDPPPLVVLHQFGSSSIEFSAYIWHASDVMSEIAARHDAIVAVHREFADNDIVIAFPQVVVWSGQARDAGPYPGPRDDIHTDLPVLEPSPRTRPLRDGFRRRPRQSDG